MNDARWLSDLWRIGFIAFMTLSTRAWCVAHTEVLSRDGVVFVREALQLEDPLPDDEHNTIAKVLRKSDHPPGYPLSILAVSTPVRAMMGTTPDSMALSAQLASVLASLLLIVPMYFLGNMLFDRQTAFVGTLIFQMLPVCTQITSDSLSDSLFLFTAVSALWLSAIGFRRSSAIWFGAAGVVSGLAYLVRPEGFIIVAVTGLVMLWSKIRGEWAWRGFMKSSTMLVLGALVFSVPYMVTIEGFSHKTTAEQLLQLLRGHKMKPDWIVESAAISEPAAQARAASGSQSVAFPLATWFPGVTSGKRPDAQWATKALGQELAKAGFYVLPLFSLIGFGLLWPRVRGDAAMQLLVVLGTCQSALIWVVALGAGYVSERHTLIIVLCSSYFAAASFPLIGEWLTRLPRLRRIGSASMWASVMALLFVAASAPAGLKTLHANRGGHRDAGLWIAAHAQPNERVIDPFSWTEYYAGNMREPSPRPRAKEPVYFVVEKGVNAHERLHLIGFANYFVGDVPRSTLVYESPDDKRAKGQRVQIYRWEGNNFDEMWAKAEFAAKTHAAEKKD